MLEQLQRLQAHIGVLKTRLHHLERENTSLTEAKALAETDHHAQIVQKNINLSSSIKMRQHLLNAIAAWKKVPLT